MKNYSEIFIQSIIDHPKRYILLSFIIFLFSIPGLMQLESNFSYRNWFKETDPILKTLDKFEKEFGSSESVTIVLHDKIDIFTLKNIQDLNNLTLKLENSLLGIKVESLINTSWIHVQEDDIEIAPFIEISEIKTKNDLLLKKNQALKDQLIIGNLLAKDAKTTLIKFRLRKAIDKKLNYPKIVDDIKGDIDSVLVNSDLDYRILGNPVITTTFKRSAMKDLKLLIPILLLIIALLIYLQFKRFKIILISLSTIFLSIITMLSAMSFLGISFNNLTSIAPELILAIGLADAIHILATYKIFRKNNSKTKAMKMSLTKNFLPTIITSLTTSCGFISFMAADMRNISDMGIVAALGTVIAWLFTYILLAPLVLVLKEKRVDDKGTVNNKPKFEVGRFIDFLFDHKRFIYGFYLILFIGSVFITTKVDINSDPLKYFRGELDILNDIAFTEKNMGGMFALEVEANSKKSNGISEPVFLEKLEEFSKWSLKTFPEITAAYSPVDIVKKMNQVFNQGNPDFYTIPKTQVKSSQLLFMYNLSVPEGKTLTDQISLNNDKVRLTLMMKNMGSTEATALFEMLKLKAKSLSLDIKLTGRKMLWQTLNEKVVLSFLKSLSLALLFVTVLLAIFLKSIKIGILSIIPNIIPIMSGAIFLVVLQRPLDIGSSIVASIVLGIAVDDTIHIVSNYLKHLRAGLTPRDSITKLFEETAPALIITSLILSISFASFILASFVPNQNLGILMSSSLMIALICDLTLLPLLLSDFVRTTKPD